jgi:hypothetical protein
MWPMTQVLLRKDNKVGFIVYADSSKRILAVGGDLPLSWTNTDSTLALTRFKSAGWAETQRGKVTNESL